MMLPSKSNSCCCVPFCHSLKRKNPSCRFFRFPKDVTRSREWVAAVRRPDFLDKDSDMLHRSHRVCSLHFVTNNYVNDNERRLKWNAVPSIFNWPQGEKLKTKKPYSNQTMSRTKNSKPKIIDSDDFVVVDLGNGFSLPCGVNPTVNRPIYPTSSFTRNDLPMPVHPQLAVCGSFDSSQMVIYGVNHFVPEVQKFTNGQLIFCNAGQYTGLDVAADCPLNADLKLKLSRRLISAKEALYRRYKMKMNECLRLLRRRISNSTFESVQAELENAKCQRLNSASALEIYLNNPKRYCSLHRKGKLHGQGSLKIPGNCETFFSILKDVVLKMKPRAKYCILMFDEASFSFKGGCLLLMARAVCEDWTLPLSNCPSANLDTTVEVVRDMMRRLQQCGLYLTAILCRQTQRNEELFSLLGINEQKPYLQVNGEKVFGMYEASHLLKCTVDDVLAEGEEWAVIKEFYGSDCEMPLRIAPKLTEEHVNPTVPFKKRHVKYAAHVMSSTVASAIYTYIAFGKFPMSAVDTVNLCSNLDRLYDSLSCTDKGFVDGNKPLLSPCTESSAHEMFWEQSLEWVQSWTCHARGKGVRKRGWLLTIRSAKDFASHLRQNGVQQLVMDKFRIEPLSLLLRKVLTKKQRTDLVFRKAAAVGLVNLRQKFCVDSDQFT